MRPNVPIPIAPGLSTSIAQTRPQCSSRVDTGRGAGFPDATLAVRRRPLAAGAGDCLPTGDGQAEPLRQAARRLSGRDHSYLHGKIGLRPVGGSDAWVERRRPDDSSTAPRQGRGWTLAEDGNAGGCRLEPPVCPLAGHRLKAVPGSRSSALASAAVVPFVARPASGCQATGRTSTSPKSRRRCRRPPSAGTA
jgi:hypothetical protein